VSRRKVSVNSAVVSNTPRSKKLLVAVSGGLDSVVLLDALIRAKRLLKIELFVAHVDHAYRHDSHIDASFVEALALKSQVPFYTHRLTAPEKKVNFEAWARTQRYRFFKKLLKEHSLDYVVTAHHSGDVAENLLMRLVSNKELRGIKQVSTKMQVIRPLLTVSKQQIIEHQNKFQLEFREDYTNHDCSFLRNRVRNKLIPIIELEFQSRAQVFIAERSLALASDLQALDQVAKEELDAIGENLCAECLSQDTYRLQVCTKSEAIAWRMIDLIFLRSIGFRLGRVKCLLILQVLQRRLRRLDLPGGVLLYWKQKKLIIGTKSGEYLKIL
jgi:tRNA(Ile)-lysidine synthase